ASSPPPTPSLHDALPISRHSIFVTFTVIIGLHLLLNLLGVRLLAGLNSISAWWHMVGVALIVFILIIVPDHHQSVGYVFGKTIRSEEHTSELQSPDHLVC